ncbi:hypothetical protein CCP3SC5AM1_810010 [Gammaproteobacteria bacterium]
MDISQNSDAAPRVLLIDLDNCPAQLNQLVQAVVHFTRVVVCYGGFEPKIQLSQLCLLAPALVEGRLAIESMERKGKNAADFGLTFWAGRLLVEMSPETEFLVLSQDGDLDYLIDMLRRAGRKVARVDGNTYSGFTATATHQDSLPDAADTAGSGSSLEIAAEDYLTVHINGRRARPARRFTLLNSIRSHFKGSGIDPDAILQELLRRGVLSLGRGGQVIYRDRLHTSSPASLPDTMSDRNVTDPVFVAAPPVAHEEVTILADTHDAETNGVPGIAGPTDEYYLAHIVNQRGRPTRRPTLLNSIRSYFKGQLTVEPEAVMAELFRRGVVTQNRGGILHYHTAHAPITTVKENQDTEVTAVIIETQPTTNLPHSDDSPPSETVDKELFPVAPADDTNMTSEIGIDLQGKVDAGAEHDIESDTIKIYTATMDAVEDQIKKSPRSRSATTTSSRASASKTKAPATGTTAREIHTARRRSTKPEIASEVDSTIT